MATILNAMDLHTSVIDTSQGFPHAKQSVTGVRVSMYLTLAESRWLERNAAGGLQKSRQTNADALAAIFGPGSWQVALDHRTLTVTHQLQHNPHNARSTSRLIAATLAAANRTLQKLQPNKQ